MCCWLCTALFSWMSLMSWMLWFSTEFPPLCYTSKVKIQYIEDLAVTLCFSKTLLLWGERGDWRCWWKCWGQHLNFRLYNGWNYKMNFVVWPCTIRMPESRLILHWTCYVNADDRDIIQFLFQRYQWNRELGGGGGVIKGRKIFLAHS